MSKKKPSRKRTPKAKQGYLEGMDPPRIKAIDDAADTYYDVMQERCRLSKEEDEAKDNLIDKMKESGVDRYETPDGLIVTITAKSNVKVKRKKEESGDEDEGDDAK